jgi:fatty acid desaturase
MAKLSRRDAERRLQTLTTQRDQALRVMRLWVYLALASILTLLFTALIWGLLYMLLFIIWTVVTTRLMRRAAQPS